MKLSAHFSLWEMIKSSTAKRRGIDNRPGPTATAALVHLCATVLEPLRVLVRKAIRVNSGFRSQELNLAIGGSSTSQHKDGEAADVEVDGLSNLELAWLIRSSSLPFDQLILEHHDPEEGPNSGWIHLSATADGNRGQVLTAMRGADGATVYVSGLPGDADV